MSESATEVVRAVPASAEQLDVEFSADMENNEYLRDPEMYTLSGGLEVRHVEVMTARKVRLWVVPPMATDQLYLVRVEGTVWYHTYVSSHYAGAMTLAHED